MRTSTTYLASAAAAVVVCLSSYSALTSAGTEGIVRAKSVYPIGETVSRLKNDIAAKGIVFFSEWISRSSPPVPASRCVHRCY